MDYVSLLWIVALALIFWLLIIRPASRRQKQTAQLQASLSVGDEVVLTSGVYGTVTALADTHLMVEIAPGVVIKVARGAVGGVVAASTGEQAGDEAEPDGPAQPHDDTTEER